MVRRSEPGKVVWKWLFKTAMERQGVLPARIVHRRKQWISDPTSRWLRDGGSARVADIVTGTGGRIGHYLDSKVLKRLWDDHREGRADNSHALETALLFEVWHRVFIDSSWPSRPGTSLTDMLR